MNICCAYMRSILNMVGMGIRVILQKNIALRCVSMDSHPITARRLTVLQSNWSYSNPLPLLLQLDKLNSYALLFDEGDNHIATIQRRQ